jgi:hypothetical protein
MRCLGAHLTEMSDDGVGYVTPLCSIPDGKWGKQQADVAPERDWSSRFVRRSGGPATASQQPVLLVRPLVRNGANLSALERT